MNLFYILGTDGAGKTTVARRIAGSLRGERRRAVYVYCQHRPLLVWMLKLPGRLLFMGKTDEFKDYEAYRRRKNAVTQKRPWLTRLYVWLSYLDVFLQTWPVVAVARMRSNLLILDRYYLDWVVNLGVLQNNSSEGMLHDARGLEWLLPRAQMHVLLDVSEEVAFRRKNDIPSLQYLRERKERYLQLAPQYAFHIVDANQDAESVFRQVRALVEEAIKPAMDMQPGTSTAQR